MEKQSKIVLWSNLDTSRGTGYQDESTPTGGHCAMWAVQSVVPRATLRPLKSARSREKHGSRQVLVVQFPVWDFISAAPHFVCRTFSNRS